MESNNNTTSLNSLNQRRFFHRRQFTTSSKPINIDSEDNSQKFSAYRKRSTDLISGQLFRFSEMN